MKPGDSFAQYLAFSSPLGESFQTYIRPMDGSEPARPIDIEVVLNWFDELEQLVPTR